MGGSLCTARQRGPLEEICGMSGLDLTGAYLKGVSLCRFVEGDGYYQRNLTDCTEQRWMDAQLPNSTAPILNDEYVVESNLFGGHDPGGACRDAVCRRILAGGSVARYGRAGGRIRFFILWRCAPIGFFSASSVTPGHRCSSTMCP